MRPAHELLSERGLEPDLSVRAGENPWFGVCPGLQGQPDWNAAACQLS